MRMVGSGCIRDHSRHNHTHADLAHPAVWIWHSSVMNALGQSILRVPPAVLHAAGDGPSVSLTDDLGTLMICMWLCGAVYREDITIMRKAKGLLGQSTSDQFHWAGKDSAPLDLCR